MPLPPPGQDFAPWAPGRVHRNGDTITGTLMLRQDFGLVIEEAEVIYDGQGLSVVFKVVEE